MTEEEKNEQVEETSEETEGEAIGLGDLLQELGGAEMMAGLAPVDESQRLIKVFGAIDAEADYVFWSAIRAYEAQDPKMPINVIINSPGGSVYSMLSIIDAMTTTTCPIRTIGTGMVMSAAVPILASGTKGMREVTKHCRIMIHQPSWGNHGSYTDMKIQAKEVDVLHKIYKDLLRTNSKLTAKQINDLVSPGDSYLSAKQIVAPKMKLADKIFKGY